MRALYGMTWLMGKVFTLVNKGWSGLSVLDNFNCDMLLHVDLYFGTFYTLAQSCVGLIIPIKNRCAEISL